MTPGSRWGLQGAWLPQRLVQVCVGGSRRGKGVPRDQAFSWLCDHTPDVAGATQVVGTQHSSAKAGGVRKGRGGEVGTQAGGPSCRAQGPGDSSIPATSGPQLAGRPSPSVWWPQRHSGPLWSCCQMDHLGQRGRQTSSWAPHTRSVPRWALHLPRPPGRAGGVRPGQGMEGAGARFPVTAVPCRACDVF